MDALTNPNPAIPPATTPVVPNVPAAGTTSVPPTGTGTPGVSTPPPGTSVPPAQPQTMETDLRDELTWQSGGKSFSVPLRDLTELYERSQQPGAAARDPVYQRAVAGDAAAARELAARMGAPEPTQEPAQQGQPEQIPIEEWNQVRSLFSNIRAERIKSGLQQRMQDLNLQALPLRPKALDEAVNKINERLASTAQALNQALTAAQSSQVINTVLREMETEEAEYQRRILAQSSPQAGSLGVSEPFRGGLPPITIQERPDPIKNPAEYGRYVQERFQRALHQDRVARASASAVG